MRLAALGVAALAACAAPPAVPSDHVISELAGRTAGPPKRCVNLEPNESLRIAGPNAFLYGAGRTVWLNVPPGDCRGLRDSDVLVTKPLGQHCRGDLVRSIDRYSKIPGPTCRLGDFIPYTRR